MRLHCIRYLCLAAWFLGVSLATAAAGRLAEKGESPQAHHERAIHESETGHWGAALAELRRTETLAPWNPAVEANLRLARSKLDQPTPANLLRVFAGVSPNVAAGTFLAAVWFWGVTRMILRWRSAWESTLRIPRIFLAAVAVSSGLLLGGSTFGRRLTADGVVVVKEAILHQGPVDAAKAQGTLPEGAEVRIFREHRGWYEIGSVRPGSTALGWVPPGQLVPVLPPWYP